MLWSEWRISEGAYYYRNYFQKIILATTNGDRSTILDCLVGRKIIDDDYFLIASRVRGTR